MSAPAIIQAEPRFTLGIEEEYFLVDPETRDLASDPPEALIGECAEQLGEQVSPEFLRSQIEIGTKVCVDMGEAHDELHRLRGGVAEVAGKNGLAIIAASTHPFAQWADQHHVDKQRYNQLADDMQGVIRRLLICGMHVHVGIEDADLRIDLMNQVRYFLPHLLALSTSSPFWRGSPTGLHSFRVSLFREMPRTGLPDAFDSFADYDRHVGALVAAGLIEDATKLWWDIRPSARFPTLEMRISDICTRVEDALCVAAIYVCLLRMLYRLRRDNQQWRTYPRMLVDENRWRAQRYGCLKRGDGGLVDFGKGSVVAYDALLEEIIALVTPDAEALGCVAHVQHARDIVHRGTSSHRQLAVFEAALADGATEAEAARNVVDWLMDETMLGVSHDAGTGA